MDNAELYHYGVKGQKWYVLRTPAQLGHEVINKIKNKNLSGVKNNTEKLKKRKFTKEDGTLKGSGQKVEREKRNAMKKEILESRSAKKLYDHADLFTTQELRSAYDRLLLEKNIKSLTPTNKNKGEKFVDTTIKWTKKATDLVNTGTNAYNSFVKIYNSFNKGDNLKAVGGDQKKSFDYDGLRKKSLNSLSDDELKALNMRDIQEKKYKDFYKDKKNK